MDSLKWALFCVCAKVSLTEASPWTIKVPSLIKGLPGSCVVIPCSFQIRIPSKKVTQFTGMWMDVTNHLIYHPVDSKIMPQYRNRTELLGDIRQRNCSLKIDPLEPSDEGPFLFRIEIKDYAKFSYTRNKVSITMMSELNPIDFSVNEEVQEGQAVSASCSVSHSCPASPPVFTWSHPGKTHIQLQQLQDGQWRTTSTLTFKATRGDHNMPLECTARYRSDQNHKAVKVLKVKYAPVNVKVEYKSNVKEGEAVLLRCSGDAHPYANRFEWHNEKGSQLYQGNVFMLPNVSRHQIGALYCTAINTVGWGKSPPVHLNVLYAPDVKAMSSCSSKADRIECVCIVDSKPVCAVHFILSDRVLPSTKVERNYSFTIGTLQADLGSNQFVICLANNTLGKANVTLFLPANSKMQSLYIMITFGVGVILLILFIAVAVVRKCMGRSEGEPTSFESTLSTMSAETEGVIPYYAATKRKEVTYGYVDCSTIYANYPVYCNMENDCDEAIYANM